VPDLACYSGPFRCVSVCLWRLRLPAPADWGITARKVFGRIALIRCDPGYGGRGSAGKHIATLIEKLLRSRRNLSRS